MVEARIIFSRTCDYLSFLNPQVQVSWGELQRNIVLAPQA